ncbi:MAG: YraN family protein [Solirubrobacterales bacterium]
MTQQRRATGRLGEQIACRHLLDEGYSIVERNARTRLGELDIVARRGRELVFVEVKTGRPNTLAGPERPALSVGARKRRRLRLLAREWIAERAAGYSAVRIDVIGVTLPGHPGGEPTLEHIEAAV